MADLGTFPPDFLELVDLYQRGRRKIMQQATTYGVHERDCFIASSAGAKSTAYNAWQEAMSHTYQGQPMEAAVIKAALTMMLNDRLKNIEQLRPPKAVLGMLGTELNKPEFLDYIEQAWEALEEKRQSDGAN